MIQQDLTAPIDRVIVSRRESFSRSYEMMTSETTPQDLTGYTFTAQLMGPTRPLASLTEESGISRPTPNAVVIDLNLIQMGELAPGKYMLFLFGDRSGSREMFVQLEMQVER
jgi:hypothetical protein